MWMTCSTRGAPCSPSPRINTPHLDATHGSMGGSHQGNGRLHPGGTWTPRYRHYTTSQRHLSFMLSSTRKLHRISHFTFRITKISDVRWAAGPFQPSNALSAYHDSLNKERYPLVQGIPVQLSKSNPVVVPLPSPKFGNDLSSIVREIPFPVYVLNAAEAECHQSVSSATSRQIGHSPEHTVLLLSLPIASGFD